MDSGIVDTPNIHSLDVAGKARYANLVSVRVNNNRRLEFRSIAFELNSFVPSCIAQQFNLYDHVVQIFLLVGRLKVEVAILETIASSTFTLLDLE